MTAKSHSHLRLVGRGRSAAAGATAVAARGGVCAAARRGQGGTASRFPGMPDVRGISTGVDGRSTGLDRLGSGSLDLQYRQEESAQTGGNDRGP
jgi:hypothetical protein